MRFLLFSKKDMSLLIIMALWIISIIFVISYSLSTTVLSENRLLPVYSVDTPEKEISLTFNCAWDDNGVDELLALLHNENIEATFFFVGDFAEKYPETVRKIYNKGHETGNHSMTHKDPVTQEFPEIVNDINQCNELLCNITGRSPVLYRAPSGSYDNKTIEAAESLGMTVVQWDVDSIDWKNPSPEKIISRVIGKTANGSIILFHLGKENTLEALPDIIKKLKNEGYVFKKTGELLLSGETYIDNSGRQRAVTEKINES